MKKICVIITARTSYTKIKPVLAAIQAHPELALQLVCAGSALLKRFGEIDQIIQKDGFEINEKIHMIVDGETLLTSAKSTGLGLIEFATTFERLKPDCVFVMADRYEQMAVAVAASYLNIPLAHAQGGEVSGNIDEKVRHAITKLADIHFPATQRAHDFIIRMGENPERVVLSGCPSTDLCQSILDQPEIDFNLFKKYGGVGAQIIDIEKPFAIVMQHPVTTEFGNAREQAKMILETVDDIDLPTLWFWPNIDAGSDDTAKAIRTYREQHNPKNIYFFRNIEPQDFLRVLNKSAMIIGNSSTAIREASYLGTPAINIGTRQSNRERAPNVIDIDYDKEDLKKAIEMHLQSPKPAGVSLYGDGQSAEKIANALASKSLSCVKKLSYLDNDAQDLQVISAGASA
jgi:UDP-hydrolysing UDP-N-acetyl-D-glucosamine 2-epimerase